MKTFIVRKYMLDDLTIVVGMVGTVTCYAAATFGVHEGAIGVHLWDIKGQAGSRNTVISAYLISVLLSPTFLFIKITFFITYGHIFGPMRWMRICALLGGIFTTLFYIAMTVCFFIVVTPHRGQTWLSNTSTQREELNLHFGVPSSAVGLVIDIYLLVLPIVAVSKLQMAPHRKLGIILIFTTGLLACLGSVLSIYYRVRLERTRDQTWALIPANTVTLLEMFVGIICACMPAASHTWQHHLPSSDSFKYHLRPRNGTSGLKLGGTNPTPSSVAESNPRDVKTSRGVHEGYVNLDVLEHELPRPVKPLQTFIYSGRPDDLNHDGINLTYEMQQSSASPPPPKRGWTTV